jgi:hypothetical protein
MNVVPASLEDEGIPFFETSGSVKPSKQRNIPEDHTRCKFHCETDQISRNGKVMSEFNVYGSVLRKYIPIHIQQDATLHSLFISGNCSTCFGCTSTHHQERIQLYLQHLVFVTKLLLPTVIVEELKLPDRNKLCKVASCWICIGIYLQCRNT